MFNIHTISCLVFVAWGLWIKIKNQGDMVYYDEGFIQNNLTVLKTIVLLGVFYVFVLLPPQLMFTKIFNPFPLAGFFYVILPLPVVVGVLEHAKTFAYLIACVVYYIYLTWFLFI